MSQGLRDMLANRRFAIPLIVLLAFCFIGLLLIGIVLIWKPGLPVGQKSVAQATSTVALAPTESIPSTSAPAPTKAPTAKPTLTLVPVGTQASSAGSQATPGATAGGQAEATAGAAASSGQEATTEPASAAGASQQEEPTPTPEDDELAQTGVGWGLVLASSVGLAALAFVARRFRLAN